MLRLLPHRLYIQRFEIYLGKLQWWEAPLSRPNHLQIPASKGKGVVGAGDAENLRKLVCFYTLNVKNAALLHLYDKTHHVAFQLCGHGNGQNHLVLSFTDAIGLSIDVEL